MKCLKTSVETINQMVAEGKKLVSQGKTEEANKLFDEALNSLKSLPKQTVSTRANKQVPFTTGLIRGQAELFPWFQ